MISYRDTIPLDIIRALGGLVDTQRYLLPVGLIGVP
jgi:hypothetical protein